MIKRFTAWDVNLPMPKVILSVLACVGMAAGQSFDVASVKVHPPGDGMRIMVRMGRGCPNPDDPGRLIFENVTLKNILTLAFGVKSYQISGPATLDGDRFDLTAKVPSGVSKDECQKMLQNLVAERFKMTVHHEQKELPALALVVAKGGVKMKKYEEAPKNPDDPPAPSRPPVSFGRGGPMPSGAMRMEMQPGRMHLNATGISMSQLVEMLSNQVGQPVVDETGLKDKYNVELEFAPDMRAMGMPMMMPPPGGGGPGGGGGGPAPEADSAPSLVTAVQDLGLKLEPKKAPLDVVVVDHIEKTPTEN